MSANTELYNKVDDKVEELRENEVAPSQSMSRDNDGSEMNEEEGTSTTISNVSTCNDPVKKVSSLLILALASMIMHGLYYL